MSVAEAVDPIDGYERELCNVAQDLSQADNREKLRELQRAFYIEAVKYYVLPLDNTKVERLDVKNISRPRSLRRNNFGDIVTDV